MLNPASLGVACWCILENKRTYPAASSSQDWFSTGFIHTQAHSDTQGIRLRGKSQKLETTESCMVWVPKITRSPAGSRHGGCPAQRGQREEARCCLDKGPPAAAVTKKSNNKKKSQNWGGLTGGGPEVGGGGAGDAEGEGTRGWEAQKQGSCPLPPQQVASHLPQFWLKNKQQQQSETGKKSKR